VVDADLAHPDAPNDQQITTREETMNRDSGMRADRLDFLKTAGLGVAGFAGGVTHGSWSVVSTAQAQTTQAPQPQQKWWSSKWGAGDEAGATNHCTPAKVLDTIKYVKDGKIYKLAQLRAGDAVLWQALIHAAHAQRANRRPVRRE
jgi:hypothetical protein